MSPRRISRFSPTRSTNDGVGPPVNLGGKKFKTRSSAQNFRIGKISREGSVESALDIISLRRKSDTLYNEKGGSLFHRCFDVKTEYSLLCKKRCCCKKPYQSEYKYPPKSSHGVPPPCMAEGKEAPRSYPRSFLQFVNYDFGASFASSSSSTSSSTTSFSSS